MNSSNPFHREDTPMKRPHERRAEEQAKVIGRPSKVRAEDVRAIRADYETGEYTHRELAAKYSLSHTTVGNIIRRINRWDSPS